MIKRLSVVLVVSLFLAFIFAGGANAISVNKSATGMRSTSSDAPAPENGMPPAPGKYVTGGVKYAGLCTDISPQVPNKIEHTQIGSTWYDFQQSGSMGRMIAVTSDGYREDSWMYTTGVYPGVGRYIRANQETPGNSWIGAINADGGTGINSGYSNQSYLHDGSSVISFHRTAGTPIWYTTLRVDDVAGANIFTRVFDVPDYIEGATSGQPGLWPKSEVFYDVVYNRDYIHIVMTEGNNLWSYPPKVQDDIPPNKYYVPVMVAYERCYIKDGPGFLDTLVCQSYTNGATHTYKVVAGANGGGSFSTVSHFDSSCGITPVVAVSPITRRVAIVYLKPACDGSCNYLSDVCFIESMSNGDDWISGASWPPSEYMITNYGCTGLERAFNDISTCYDFNDSLHIVYVTTNLDWKNVGHRDPHVARLYHWSKKDGPSLITNAIWGGTRPDAHSCNIAKASISAQDPVYHPGGDSVFLYCIWTQFDSADNAANGFSNGDIYGSGSDDGGSLWSRIFNLTYTQTPGCAPGACLSEHWSSLAQNMYEGDLHIQYVCDKDAGAAAVGEGSWRDNPLMYLHLAAWPIDHFPRVAYEIVDPPTWYGPPLKVAPNGNVILTFDVTNIGNANLVYHVNSDDPCIQVNTPPTVLLPQQTNTVTAVVSGAGTCNHTFIDGMIHLISNDDDPLRQDIPLQVQAVVSADYYECPRDPATTDTMKNGVMNFYFNANSQEWMHDTSTVLGQDTTYDVFFQGGPFVATTIGIDTLVGRYYGDNDARILAQKPLCRNDSYSNFWIEATWSASMNKLYPPMDTKWWWFDILHQSVFFKSTASTDLKNCVIKFFTVYRWTQPPWWPSQPAFTGYEDTYVGLMMDIDCPYDTNAGQSARNKAGYDATNNIAWQSGSHNPNIPAPHSAYDDYYAGIALIKGQLSESEVPYGTYNLCNDDHLYPNGGWGWLEQDFYDIAKGNTLGVIEFGPGLGDSIKDRSQVVTAKQIASSTALSDSSKEVSFTVVEAIGQTGLAQLQTRVAAARTWVAGTPATGRPFHNLCGDASGDCLITVSDVVLILNYLFKGAPSSTLAPPRGREDLNGDGKITVSDAVLLLNYLFKGALAKDTFKCPTVW